MELLFARHGESVGNASGDYSTSRHDRLSPEGLVQAEVLATRLSTEHVDAIYASPLRRATETIVPFLQHSGLVAEIWAELAEACWQEDRDAEPPADRAPTTHVTLPGGLRGCFMLTDENKVLPSPDETYAEGLGRIKRVYELLMERHGDTSDTVLIAGHGHAGGRLLEMFLGLEPTGRFDHDNTGCSRLVRQADGSFLAHYINRT